MVWTVLEYRAAKTKKGKKSERSRGMHEKEAEDEQKQMKVEFGYQCNQLKL